MRWAQECKQRVAIDPARAAPKLTWDPCPGGLPGCVVFKTPSAPAEEVLMSPTVRRGEAGWWVGIWLTFLPDKTFTNDIGVLYDPAGTAVVSVRGPRDACQPEPLAGPDGGCVQMRVFEGARAVIKCGGTADIVSACAPTVSLPFVPQLSWFTGDILSMWLAGASAVFDLESEKTRSIESAWSRPSAWGAYQLAVRAYGQSNQAVLWKRPDDVVPLVEGAPPNKIVSADLDGKWIVWLEAAPKLKQADPLHPSATLYRSPFATTKAGIVRSKLRDLGPVHPAPWSAAGSGYLALTNGNDVKSLLLFRIADGRRWVVPTPEGYELWGGGVPAGLDDQYLFYTATDSHGFGVRGLIRQRLDALGSGD